MYYGWRHAPDGASEATKWVTFCHFPVVPLGRHRLRVLTDFTNEPKWTTVQMDRFELHGRAPLRLGEVLRTYVMAYVLLPMALLSPISLFYGLVLLVRARPEWREATWPLYVSAGLAAVYLGYICLIVLWTLRRARGFRGGFFE